MKAQTAQTSTSTRPQQPTAAYAATLPVETLARIFELALQHFVWPNEEKGQAQRAKFGLVCRSWCSAALPLPHYIISSSSKAQRLTDLLRTTDRSRQAVRSLDIVAEKDKGSGRGERIAKLLKMCPNLARVTIQVDRDLCAPARRDQDGSLGKVVQDALASLDLVSFEFYGDQLPVPVLQRLIKEWPQLTDLTIWISYSYSRDTLVLPSSSHLRSLSLPAVTDLNLTKALIAATVTTLEVLKVGEVYPSKGEELLAVIQPVLAQLVKFTIADGDKPTWGPAAQQPRVAGTYVESMLREMKSMRYLSIGLDGFDFTNLFSSLLAELKHLRHFTLRPSRQSPSTLLKNCDAHAPALLSFIDAAPSSFTAISLRVPLNLEFGDGTGLLLERMAQKKGIDLVWLY